MHFPYTHFHPFLQGTIPQFPGVGGSTGGSLIGWQFPFLHSWPDGHPSSTQLHLPSFTPTTEGLLHATQAKVSLTHLPDLSRAQKLGLKSAGKTSPHLLKSGWVQSFTQPLFQTWLLGQAGGEVDCALRSKPKSTAKRNVNFIVISNIKTIYLLLNKPYEIHYFTGIHT